MKKQSNLKSTVVKLDKGLHKRLMQFKNNYPIRISLAALVAYFIEKGLNKNEISRHKLSA